MLLVHVVLVVVLACLRVGGEPLLEGVGVYLRRDELRWIDFGNGGGQCAISMWQASPLR